MLFVFRILFLVKFAKSNLFSFFTYTQSEKNPLDIIKKNYDHVQLQDYLSFKDN